MIDFIAEHQKLLTKPEIALGTILWRFLYSDQQLSVAIRGEKVTSGPSTLQRTEFGEEVGGDNVHWWVNKRAVLVVGVTNERREVVGVSKPETRHTSILAAIKRLMDISEVEQIIRVVPVPYGETNAKTICLVIAVAQTREIVGVRGENGSYIYPVRQGPGTIYESPKTIERRKRFQHPGNNFGFMKRLEAMVYDR